jgi:hypothetical protein
MKKIIIIILSGFFLLISEKVQARADVNDYSRYHHPKYNDEYGYARAPRPRQFSYQRDGINNNNDQEHKDSSYTGYEKALNDDWVTTIVWENDFFAGDDDNYTNGGMFSLLSPEISNSSWIGDIANLTPFFDDSGSKRISYSFGQSMYTPKNIFSSQLVQDQRPYAGWLYGSAGIISDTGNVLDKFVITLGVVGNSSLAEEVQEEVHNAMDILVPRGWSNQLEDEPGIVISYEKALREYYDFGFGGMGFDITPKAGFSLGNVFTYASAGATLRIGRDLPSDYGVPKIRPRMPGGDYFAPRKNWGMYVFADVETRAVARNIFLDGNTWKDSHSVDKKTFVHDIQLGTAITIQKVRIAYTHIFRSKEYNGQDRDFDNFAAVTISARY